MDDYTYYTTNWDFEDLYSVQGTQRYVISKRANRIKGDASLDELKMIASWLEKRVLSDSK